MICLTARFDGPHCIDEGVYRTLKQRSDGIKLPLTILGRKLGGGQMAEHARHDYAALAPLAPKIEGELVVLDVRVLGITLPRSVQ